MKFTEIIKYLEKGEKATRKTWRSSAYIRLQGDLAKPDSCSIIDSVNIYWKPCYSDIKANDWEVFVF